MFQQAESFLEHLPVAGVLVDPQGTILFQNSQAAQLFPNEQYRALQAQLQAHFTSFNPVANSTFTLPATAQLPQSCYVQTGELISENGRTGIPLFFSLVQDTDDSTNLFLHAFRINGSVQLLIAPKTAEIVDANPAACAFYGYDHQTITNMTIWDINVLPKDWVQEEMRNAYQQKRNHFNFKHRLANGEIHQVEVYSAPLVINNRPLLHSVVIDVSKRQRRVETLINNNDALLHERNRLTEIIRAAQVGTWEWFPQSGEIRINEEWATMLGYKLAELEPTTIETFESLCHPEDLKSVNACLEKHFRRETGYYECELRMRHKEGRWIWVLDHGQVVEWNEHAEPLRVSGTHTDISRQKNNETKLQLSANVFSHAREGILVTDSKARIIEANNAFCRITGYALEEVLGKKPNLLKSSRHQAEFYREMWEHLAQYDYWAGEVWNRRKSGDEFVEHLTISVLRNSTGEVENYIGIFSDITSYKLHQQQLEYLAHFDSLTGLPNRVLLGERLTAQINDANRYGKQLGLAFIDLDGFKEVNDQHGHDFGDELLGLLAQRMQLCLRDGDTLARLGGDEFVAVITELQDQNQSIAVINRLLKAACDSYHVREKKVTISASIGVSFYPQQEDISADQLIRQADQAMYQAKLAGKNNYSLFATEKDLALRGRSQIIEEISRGLQLNQFILYYQPKINLREGKIRGAEALIRWQHPEQGLISPGMFIPATEEHSVSIDIGEWVIDTALQQIEQWHHQGIDLPVSVNLSAYHLQQESFPERLTAILARYPTVPNSYLEIELLETSALEDLPRVLLNMELCSQLGVSFALDDFGTGYSSLAYLKRLPVSIIKIDQTFIRDILHDIDDLTLTHGIVGLARAYHLGCIAEGVETADHCISLLLLGCELAQGYGLGMPMHAEDFQPYFNQWSPDPIWATIQPLAQEDMSVLYVETINRARILALEADKPQQLNRIQKELSQEHDLGIWLATTDHQRFANQANFKQAQILYKELQQAFQKRSQQAKERPLQGHELDQLKRLSQELSLQLLNLFITPSSASNH